MMKHIFHSIWTYTCGFTCDVRERSSRPSHLIRYFFQQWTPSVHQPLKFLSSRFSLCLVCFLCVFPYLWITCLSNNIFFILSLKEPRKIPKASLETPEKQNTRPTNKTKIKGKQDSQIEQGTGSESGEPKTKQKARNKTVAESNTTSTKKKGVKYNRTIICWQ